MLCFRLLEIKFRRRILLSHITDFVEQGLEPVATKFVSFVYRGVGKVRSTHLNSMLRIKSVKEGMKASAHKYVADFHEMNRGKRMLSRGSVSFFLLNITHAHEAEGEVSKKTIEETLLEPERELVEKGE